MNTHVLNENIFNFWKINTYTVVRCADIRVLRQAETYINF